MKCKFCGAEVVLGKACDYCGSVAEFSYYNVERQEENTVKIPIERKITNGKYTVQKGDTLWHIAKSFYGRGTEFTKIVKANKIRNPNLIYPGQVLQIPRSGLICKNT